MYPTPAGFGYPGVYPGMMPMAPAGMMFVMTPQGMMQVPADPNSMMMMQMPTTDPNSMMMMQMPTTDPNAMMMMQQQQQQQQQQHGMAGVGSPAVIAAPPPPPADDDWGDFQKSDGPVPRGVGSLPVGSSLFAAQPVARPASPPPPYAAAVHPPSSFDTPPSIALPSTLHPPVVTPTAPLPTTAFTNPSFPPAATAPPTTFPPPTTFSPLPLATTTLPVSASAPASLAHRPPKAGGLLKPGEQTDLNALISQTFSASFQLSSSKPAPTAPVQPAPVQPVPVQPAQPAALRKPVVDWSDNSLKSAFISAAPKPIDDDTEWGDFGDHTSTATPIMLPPSVSAPTIVNPSVVNASVVNPSIINPSIINPAVINPAVTNPSVVYQPPMIAPIATPISLPSATIPTQDEDEFGVFEAAPTVSATPEFGAFTMAVAPATFPPTPLAHPPSTDPLFPLTTPTTLPTTLPTTQPTPLDAGGFIPVAVAAPPKAGTLLKPGEAADLDSLISKTFSASFTLKPADTKAAPPPAAAPTPTITPPVKAPPTKVDWNDARLTTVFSSAAPSVPKEPLAVLPTSAPPPVALSAEALPTSLSTPSAESSEWSGFTAAPPVASSAPREDEFAFASATSDASNEDWSSFAASTPTPTASAVLSPFPASFVDTSGSAAPTPVAGTNPAAAVDWSLTFSSTNASSSSAVKPAAKNMTIQDQFSLFTKDLAAEKPVPVASSTNSGLEPLLNELTTACRFHEASQLAQHLQAIRHLETEYATLLHAQNANDSAQIALIQKRIEETNASLATTADIMSWKQPASPEKYPLITNILSQIQSNPNLPAEAVKAFTARFNVAELLELAKRDLIAAVQRVDQAHSEFKLMLQRSEQILQNTKVSLQTLRKWRTALQQCLFCFVTANNLLDDICAKVGNRVSIYPVLAAEQKFADYFKALIEVYRISKRIHTSYQKTPKAELDVLLATLPQPHPLVILRDLAKALSMVVSKLEVCKIAHLLPWKDIQVPKEVHSHTPVFCTLCGIPLDTYERSLDYRDQVFHAECANFTANILEKL